MQVQMMRAARHKLFGSSPPIKGHYDRVEDFLDIKTYLGSGGNSEVFRAIEKRLNTTVAVKILKKPGFEKSWERPVEVYKLLKELKVLQVLPHHPNICRFYYLLETREKYLLVMDICGHTELWSLLFNWEQKPQPETLVFNYTVQVLRGLNALHQAGIYHLDVKLNNLMLDSTGRVRIIDFGSSVFSNKRIYLEILTPTFECPEEYFAEGFIPEMADVWGLGVCAYDLLTYKNFEAEVINSEFFGITYKYSYPPQTQPSELLRDFLSKIFVHQSKRAKTTELLKHPWITNNTQ